MGRGCRPEVPEQLDHGEWAFELSNILPQHAGMCTTEPFSEAYENAKDYEGAALALLRPWRKPASYPRVLGGKVAVVGCWATVSIFSANTIWYPVAMWAIVK